MVVALPPLGHARVEQYDTRDAWLAARRLGIGGSDVAAIVTTVCPLCRGNRARCHVCGDSGRIGAHPYKSALELWSEKSNLVEPPPVDNDAAEAGHRLEDAVRRWFEDRAGVEVRGMSNALAVHPSYEWARCSPDGVIFRRDTGVGLYEGKTASLWRREEFEDGNLPLYYKVQVQWSLFVTGLPYAALAVLIGGQHFVYRREIPRHEPLIARLEAAACEFMERVATGRAPPADGSPGAARALRLLHPRSNGTTTVLPRVARRLALTEQYAKTRIDRAERVRERARQRLRQLIGDNEAGVIPGVGVYTIREQTTKRREVYAQTKLPKLSRPLRFKPAPDEGDPDA